VKRLFPKQRPAESTFWRGSVDYDGRVLAPHGYVFRGATRTRVPDVATYVCVAIIVARASVVDIYIYIYAKDFFIV
jgi:hypothetical protein